MTNKEKHTQIWILRIIKYIHKRTGIHPFMISIVIFGIFPYLMLSFLHHGLVDDIGIICAFICLGLAPYFILLAVSLIESIRTQLLPLVRDCKEEFEVVYSHFITSFHSKQHFIIGVPFALVIDIIVYYAFMSSLNVLALSFLLMCISILSVFVGIGFWGISQKITFVWRICSLPLYINPLHHDKFGGMKFIATYSVRSALLFSSGCLLLPGAFETFKLLAIPQVYYMAVAITILFSLFVVASFLIPLYCLHIKARDEKSKILRVGERRIIDEVFPLYQKKEKLDPNQIYPIFILYSIEEKLEQMTTIPIDAKQLVDIGIILVEPIIIIKGIFELMGVV